MIDVVDRRIEQLDLRTFGQWALAASQCCGYLKNLYILQNAPEDRNRRTAIDLLPEFVFMVLFLC